MSIDEAVELASQHQRGGRLQQAEAIYRQVLAADPNHADALNLLGVLAYQTGHLDVAEDLIRRSIAVRPTAITFFNFGVVLGAKRKADEAARAYRQAIELQNVFPEAYSNLSAVLLDMNRTDEALSAVRTALSFRPDLPEAHSNLGDVLQRNEEFDDAIAAFRRAIELKPDYADVHNNLGNALIASNVGHIAEAIACFHRALALKADHPTAQYNLSLALLRQGNLEQGFALYQSRWRVPECAHLRPNLVQPMWDGRDLNDQCILLHHEQGFGDTIQFVRYAPLIAARGGKVILSCPTELARLFKCIPEVEQIVPHGAALPDFDVHLPLPSAPMVMKTTLETIPATVPYLRADPASAQAWQERIAQFDGSLKVGLVWAGRPTHTKDRWRSMPFSAMTPLAQVANVRFFSLQKGPAAEQARQFSPSFELVDWTHELNDFADTAGLIDQLDLVISVDTAIAHLAGAMGKPAWVLLPVIPDWRWMIERPDSPWYPTLRLFRQPARCDWEKVIQQIVQELGRLSPAARHSSGSI